MWKGGNEMNYYILNGDVLCFTQDLGNSNGTMVIEKNRKFTVEIDCFKLLKKSCIWYGNSYNIQRQFVVDKFNFYIKTPIVMNGKDVLIFFPTCSPNSKECIWVSYNNVDRYVKEKDYTKIYFKGGKILNISASYGTIDNQITRCVRIEKYINDRIVKNR